MRYADEIYRQEPMSLAAAAKAFGRLRGRVPHVSTVWRWCTKGVRGVRLQSYVVGGTRVITAEAIDTFLAQTSDSALQWHEHVPVVHDRALQEKRKEEIRAARERLQARCTPVMRGAGGNPIGAEQNCADREPRACNAPLHRE